MLPRARWTPRRLKRILPLIGKDNGPNNTIWTSLNSGYWAFGISTQYYSHRQAVFTCIQT